ncbi:MAG: GIY-YIG nuclease family protein [Planctomycetota bacterium]
MVTVVPWLSNQRWALDPKYACILRSRVMPESPWILYLLRSSKEERTYVGITMDLDRRLLQHNGELAGGAKATRRGRPWVLHSVVGRFEDRSAAQMAEAEFKKLKGDQRLQNSAEGQED